MAISYKNKLVISFLFPLSSPATINTVNKGGNTALTLACYSRNGLQEEARALTELMSKSKEGIDAICAIDYYNNTALGLACFNGWIDEACALASFYSSFKALAVSNQGGNTTYDYAKTKLPPDVVKLIQDRMVLDYANSIVHNSANNMSKNPFYKAATVINNENFAQPDNLFAHLEEAIPLFDLQKIIGEYYLGIDDIICALGVIKDHAKKHNLRLGMNLRSVADAVIFIKEQCKIMYPPR